LKQNVLLANNIRFARVEKIVQIRANIYNTKKGFENKFKAFFVQYFKLLG
jgi:hypothetical protein